MVGLLFLLVQLVLVPHPLGLTTDEATYLAKVNPSVPELYWTEPRAWGVPVLTFPVAIFSPGLIVVRTYLAVLSSLGLIAAFWPWLGLGRRYVAPLAALLFSTVWFVVLFGSQAMPNLYVALSAVAAIGGFRRAVQDRAKRWLVLTVLAAAVLALVRPTDSVLVLAPVVLISLLVRRLRWPAALAAVVVGDVLGWLPWVIESFTRFGGPFTRLAAAEESGPKGVSLHLDVLLDFPRLLDGAPGYFSSGASNAGGVPVGLTLWLLVGILLVLLGLVVAVRERRIPEALLLYVPAGLLAVFYLMVTSFTALRFVIPVFALLSLPVAAALVHVLATSAGRRRTLTAALVGLVLVGWVGVGWGKSARWLDAQGEKRDVGIQVAAEVAPLVSSTPCLVLGKEPQVVGYYLGCSVALASDGKKVPPRASAALRKGWAVVVVLSEPASAGTWLDTWQQSQVGAGEDVRTVYLPPA